MPQWQLACPAVQAGLNLHRDGEIRAPASPKSAPGQHQPRNSRRRQRPRSTRVNASAKSLGPPTSTASTNFTCRCPGSRIPLLRWSVTIRVCRLAVVVCKQQSHCATQHVGLQGDARTGRSTRRVKPRLDGPDQLAASVSRLDSKVPCKSRKREDEDRGEEPAKQGREI
jgi:hypothetical protein